MNKIPYFNSCLLFFYCTFENGSTPFVSLLGQVMIMSVVTNYCDGKGMSTVKIIQHTHKEDFIN